MYKGDDTQAFGGSFLTINVTNNTGHPITKLVWDCGAVEKVFDNPKFPLEVNLTSKETAKLSAENVCYVAAWDDEGRKLTCQGKLIFNTKPEVVNDGHKCRI